MHSWQQIKSNFWVAYENAWPEKRRLSFAEIIKNIKDLQHFPQKITWEQMPTAIQGHIIHAVRYRAHSLTCDQVILLHRELSEINKPLNKFPYEIIRACIQTHFEQAISLNSLGALISFSKWLKELGLGKDHLSCRDVRKLKDHINIEKQLLGTISVEVSNEIKAIFSYFSMPSGEVRDEVRELYRQCCDGNLTSKDAEKIIEPVLLEPKKITPSEIASICASLVKAGLHSQKINGLLLPKVHELNSSQLLSVLNYLSILKLARTESHGRKSNLLLMVIEQFISLCSDKEDEAIEFLKLIETIKVLNSKLYQAESAYFINAGIANFIRRHKVSANIYESLFHVISLLIPYGARKDVQVFILQYLEYCRFPFEYSKPCHIPYIFSHLPKLGIQLDELNSRLIKFFTVMQYNSLEYGKDICLQDIPEEINFMHLISTANARNNPLIKDSINLLSPKTRSYWRVGFFDAVNNSLKENNANESTQHPQKIVLSLRGKIY